MADDVTITLRLAQVGAFVRDSQRSRDALRDVGAEVDRTSRRSKLASIAGGGFSLLGRTFVAVTRAAAAVTVGVGSVATVLGFRAVGAASDLNETLSKTDQIFGQMSPRMKAWGVTTAASLGMSQNEALTAAANYGNLFLNLGATEDAAAKMSKQLVVTAADLASFNNATPQEMLEAMSSALAGEFDPLQRYGFAISAAAVQQKALKLGLAETTEEISAADTAQAAYALILAQTGKAQGDFARTSDGLANQQRILAAQWQNLKAQAGQALLPAVLSVVGALNTQLLPVLADLVDRYGPAVGAWVTQFVTGDVPKFVSWLQDVGERYGPKVTAWLSEFTAAASGADGTSLSGLGASISDLVSSLGQIGGDLGQGVADTASVASVAIGFLADHTDELAAAMPWLIAGLIAYRGAQAAANVVELAAMPVKLLEIATNLRLAASQRMLARAITTGTVTTTANTTATGVNTAATNAGMLATIRHRVATVASTIASKAALVATKAWAAGQWLLNAALLANPVGLVIVAIVALVAIFVVAYKKVGWFRDGVNTAMRWVLSAIRGVWGWAKRNWPLLLGILTGPIGAAVALITTNADRIKGVFKGLVNSIIGFWNGLDLRITIPQWMGKIPGFPDDVAGQDVDIFPDVPLLARGGRAVAPGVAIVGEEGPEAITLPVGASVVPLDPSARQSLRADDGRPQVVQLVLDRRVVAEVALAGRNDIAARR